MAKINDKNTKESTFIDDQMAQINVEILHIMNKINRYRAISYNQTMMFV